MSARLTAPERTVRSLVLRFLHWKHHRTAVNILVVLAIIISGILIQIPQFGQILFMLYGIIALLVGIKSSETFKMAIIAMLCIPLIFLSNNKELASSFAVYAFLLICIGTLSSIAEEWRRNKKAQKNVKKLTKTGKNDL